VPIHQAKKVATSAVVKGFLLKKFSSRTVFGGWVSPLPRDAELVDSHY